VADQLSRNLIPFSVREELLPLPASNGRCCRGTDGSQTHRWREMDSNFPFRARYGFGSEISLWPALGDPPTAAADKRATACSRSARLSRGAGLPRRAETGFRLRWPPADSPSLTEVARRRREPRLFARVCGRG